MVTNSGRLETARMASLLRCLRVCLWSFVRIGKLIAYITSGCEKCVHGCSKCAFFLFYRHLSIWMKRNGCGVAFVFTCSRCIRSRLWLLRFVDDTSQAWYARLGLFAGASNMKCDEVSYAGSVLVASGHNEIHRFF